MINTLIVSYGKVKKYFKSSKVYIMSLFISAVFIMFLTTIESFFIGYAVKAISQIDFTNFIKYMAIYFLVSLLIRGLWYNYSYVFYNIKLRFEPLFMKDIYEKIMHLPTKAFDEGKRGMLLNRIKESEEVVRVFERVMYINLEILKVVFMIGILLWLDFYLFIMFIIFVLSIYFLHEKYGHKIKKNFKESRRFGDDFLSKAEQSIAGIREIKSLGAKKITIEETLEKFNFFKNKEFLGLVINNNLTRVRELIILIFNVAILLYVGYLISRGKLGLEHFVVVRMYLDGVIKIVDRVGELNVEINKMEVTLDRILEIIDNKFYDDERFGDKRITDICGNIELKNLTFAYKDNIKVLDSINVQICANKKTAIVGRSGSGKTSILNLILCLYEKYDGEIRIDNIDIREFDEESIRRHISVIRQDPFLFNTTIYNNLKLGNPEAMEEEVYEVCKKAHIHEYIESLKDKYETIIGEGGINLSGGQKQRIAIARALLKNSKIILFDEATSALDNESQGYIKQTINEIGKERTVVIVAHRLSTIIDADEILLVDKGKVIDKGTHEQLLQKSELYSSLYKADEMV